MMSNKEPCICGSGDTYIECCGTGLSLLHVNQFDKEETILNKWVDTYSPPSIQMFRKKLQPQIYQLSCYLDWVIDEYLSLGFERDVSNKDIADKEIRALKHNILLSELASYSCLSQGLFLQSGTILRSLIEDCFVLVDIFENHGQIEKFLERKYSTTGVVSRVKNYIPNDMAKWYGILTTHFTHMGPLHPKSHVPVACYPDNYVITQGFYNLICGVVAYHTILERIYFQQIEKTYFWIKNLETSELHFNDNNSIYAWAELFKEEGKVTFPLDKYELRPNEYKPK